MKGSTHLAAGVAVALKVAPPELVPVAAVIAGSLLPDIDSSCSMLGRHIPIIPKLIQHRGVTHCVLFAALMYLLNPWLGYGCILHIALDMCTTMGVSLLWPVRWKIRIPIIGWLVKSGGTFDAILCDVLWAFNIWTVAKMIFNF